MADEHDNGDEPAADSVSTDDPKKTEKLAKAGRDEIDPDEGSD